MEIQNQETVSKKIQSNDSDSDNESYLFQETIKEKQKEANDWYEQTIKEKQKQSIKARTFLDKDLLTFDELEKLIILPFPDEKSEIVASKLLNYFMIHDEKYYRYDIENVLFYKEKNNSDYLLKMISSFIGTSYKKLKKREQKDLMTKHKSCFKIFSNASINTYLPQLKTDLTNDNVDFSDPHIMEIHF